ncbi:MAG: VPLPA-CTERM sorting domain-containing protein [Silicimonas sp.]|nr:VPLPA-CTERM sorting domain-containing protein [Silicimonas sp.]
MTFKGLAVGVVATLALSTPAISASLSLNSIDGVWQNASPSVSGEGTSQIRWGTPAYTTDGSFYSQLAYLLNGGQQSGYDFDASGDMVVEDNTTFVLGTFTHLNYPIRDTLLTSVDLSLSFMIDGVTEAITSVFSFDHWETHNEAEVCANGEGREDGLNISGCADRVTATLNEAMSETFVIDGVTYVLDISGFLYEGELMTDFWTLENQSNEALLVGSFRVVPSEVPLPATGLLLLGGLAGMAMVRRRRR